MTTPTTTKKPAPAAKAPAKKAAPKATGTGTKITWKLDGEKDAKGQAPGTGTAGDRVYKITGSGEQWSASVKFGSKTTVLGENLKSGGAAWAACVRHNKGVAK